MKPLSSSVSSAVSGSYGNFHGTSKLIDIPQVCIIIGKGGEITKYLQLQSGVKIQVQRENKHVELEGTPEQVAKAKQLIKDVVPNEAKRNGMEI